MSKYNAIRDLLEVQTGEITLRIGDLDKLVAGGLAPSASKWELWWTNDDPTHSHSRSWGAAGYVAVPDLAKARVTFKPAKA